MLNSNPLISVVLLNWNGFSFTTRCIDSLLRSSYKPLEIILFDNGSDNNEGKKIYKKYKNYKTVSVYLHPKNIGYAAGMNLAVKKAKGHYIMLINNDMEFEKKWAEPLVRKLQNNPNVAAVQPKIKDLKQKGKFEYAAAAGGFIDIFGYPFARGRIFEHVEYDNGQYDTPITVCWGGILLLRKQVIDAVGLFDTIYYAYAEDVDLCCRIYGAGWKIVYEPSSIVYHFGGAAFGKNLANKMFYIHRNHLILILKNWPKKILLFIILPRILMDFLAMCMYVVKGYPKSAFSVIRAYWSLLCKLPEIITARKNVKEFILTKKLSGMPIYNRSIVFDYFLFHKRSIF